MNIHLRKILSALPCVVLALLITGCASTPIFRANFDTDTVGALPNPNPPGNPVGDAIWSTAAGDTNMLVVVNDPVIGSRSLRFANNGPLIRYVGFIPVDMSSGADHVFAYWIGVVGATSAPLDVWLGDTHFSAIGGVRFDGGNLLVRTPTGYDSIGTYAAGTSHVMIFTFNKGAGTFSVSFLQGSHSASQEDMPLLSPAAGTTIRPTLYMSYFSGGSSSARYVVDEVIISEREPDM